MSEKFSSILKYVAGSVAYNIWQDLNPGTEDNVNTNSSIKELIEFFAFAISQNIIVEYDFKKNIPIFSGDLPIVVANRIFRDFYEKNSNVPEKSPSNSDDFVAYMICKQGWAVLYQGTRLILPEI
ncbi:hypothetical protein NKW54_08770 [Acetobacter cerevisiae]|uniref:Uncharacterized protein n=1 Tax=Acetobacter cerevisiae TaxID=178900 RepID=A0ABT1ERN6_9PROT|nr:hypothetical protein [Acetobacter cerevisiae]MCP1246030.1 hypothetical protein [Acetobacter cerevisiae]MCP1255503.1 hypothetical protein [Acetobacter cerevisiae]